MVSVNAVLIFRNGDRAMRDVQTLTACLHLVKAANDLAATHGDGASLPQLAALRVEAGNRADLRKSLRPLAWLKLPAISVVATWLNFAFLVELLAQVRAIQRFALLRHKLAPPSSWWAGSTQRSRSPRGWSTARSIARRT